MAQKTVQIRLHTAFYPMAAVREAAKAYGELAHVAIERAGDHLRVRLTPKVDEPDLADAFASHALALAVRRRRSAE
jgi:hypothetical protein